MKKIKRLVLVVSGIATVPLLVINATESTKITSLCNPGSFTCYDTISSILQILLPALPLFLFSFITYFQSERVFRSWFYGFAVWWIPLSMLLTFITPKSGGGWGPGISTGPVDAAFVLSVLFAVISIIIIVVSYFKDRRA